MQAPGAALSTFHAVATLVAIVVPVLATDILLLLSVGIGPRIYHDVHHIAVRIAHQIAILINAAIHHELLA